MKRADRQYTSRFVAVACRKCYRAAAARAVLDQAPLRIWCEHRNVLQAWVGGGVVVIVSATGHRAQAEATLNHVRRVMRLGQGQKARCIA